MTAKEAFFLEAGIMPIKCILSKRRLLYLWNILNRNDNELLKRFYHTQKLLRTKNDWVELVEQDKEDFGIDISDDEISKMKESKFKSLVNKSVIQKSLDHLNTVADGHSKSKNLVKPKMVREPYFDDSRFSRSDIELLFSLRTRMLDLKGNFSNKYGLDIACRVCKVQIECQEHILKCEVLKKNVDVPSQVVYEDIFRNVDKQLEVVKAFRILLREREIFMNTEAREA